MWSDRQCIAHIFIKNQVSRQDSRPQLLGLAREGLANGVRAPGPPERARAGPGAAVIALRAGWH